MSQSEDLLTRVLSTIDKHLRQIDESAVKVDKDGLVKGYTGTDAGVIERYAKLLITMNKKDGDGQDEFDGMSDEELEAEALGDNNVGDT